jgi:hypothetical protein
MDIPSGTQPAATWVYGLARALPHPEAAKPHIVSFSPTPTSAKFSNTDLINSCSPTGIVHARAGRASTSKVLLSRAADLLAQWDDINVMT